MSFCQSKYHDDVIWNPPDLFIGFGSTGKFKYKSIVNHKIAKSCRRNRMHGTDLIKEKSFTDIADVGLLFSAESSRSGAIK